MASKFSFTSNFIATVFLASSLGFSITQTVAASPILVAQSVTGSVMGQLDENSETFGERYQNIHTFEGTAGESIQISLTSEDFWPFLALIGPLGSEESIWSTGETGDDPFSSQVSLALPGSGSYQILVTSYGENTTGSYTISWESTQDLDIQLEENKYYDLNFQPNTDQTSLQETRIAVISVLEDEITAARQRLGNNHPDIAEYITTLAVSYGGQGRYDDAERLYLEALDIYNALPGSYSAERAIIFYQLGLNTTAREQFERSEFFYQQALDILLEDAGGREDMIPVIQTQLAHVYEAQGSNTSAGNSLTDSSRQADAEALLVQAVETARLDNEPFELAIDIDVLANFYHRQGQYEEAEELYREALGIRRSLAFDGVENPSTATSLNNLALLYQAQGRYKEAEDFYGEALAIYEVYNEPALDSRRVSTYYNLAGLYRITDDFTQALDALRAGIDIEEKNLDISLANLGESDRIAYVAQLADTINYVISFNLDAAPNLSDAKQLALTTVLRRKGRVLEAGTRAQEILQQRATPDDIDLLNQLSQARREIASLTSQQTVGLSATEYQARLAQLRSEVNELETVLARLSADLALDSQSVNINAVQAQIPKDGVLIEYALYQSFDPKNPVDEQINQEDVTAAGSNRFDEPRYAAYLLFPNGQIEVVDLGNATEIDAAVQTFISLLQDQSAIFRRNSGTVMSVVRPDVVANTTDTLYSLIFEPLAPYLQGVDHLLISPDSQLNQVPFEALQPEAGEEYLVQQYQLSYLNSGRDLLKLDVVEPSQNPAVILADPDYETAQVSPSRSVEGDLRSADLGQLQFGRLHGTAAEAEAIQTLLPNADILTETEATENALKQVQSPQILHIATHGFFLPDLAAPDSDIRSTSVFPIDPASITPRATSTDRGLIENPLLRSGLALAGFNSRQSGSEDGVLTALEAANLNLFGTQLVVLSACETGLGDIANGEGVYGLRRAFALAGAESQLMSLWQVSDSGTQSLMAQYYENLTTGMGRSEALRAVQLHMIESGEEYSHPYYWAAFILAGDWRPF
ncbi:MAG: CHAT domain-containing tetratricopeptide repeat protein [Thainema sp.]